MGRKLAKKKSELGGRKESGNRYFNDIIDMKKSKILSYC